MTSKYEVYVSVSGTVKIALTADNPSEATTKAVEYLGLDGGSVGDYVNDSGFRAVLFYDADHETLVVDEDGRQLS